MSSIPEPAFADDDGEVSPEVATALSAYDASPDDRGRALGVVAALQESRVLVPVVALPGEEGGEEPGPDADQAQERSTDMAAVLMRAKDGRQALLAFSGLERLQRWDPQVRPVPLTLVDAARSARQQGADALVLDVAGPVLFALETEHLESLADGMRLLHLADGGWGWVEG